MLSLTTVTAANRDTAIADNLEKIYNEMAFKFPCNGKISLQGDLNFLGESTVRGMQANGRRSATSRQPSTRRTRVGNFYTNAFARKLALHKEGIPQDIKVLVVGDSLSEGFIATSHDNRWPIKFRDKMQASLGLPNSKSRFHSANYTDGLGQSWVYSSPVTRGTYTGLGLRNVTLSTTQTATLAFTGTGLDLHYLTAGTVGSFTYQVDALPAVFVVAYDDRQIKGCGGTQIRGLSSGAHSILITPLFAPMVLEGAFVYDGDESVGFKVYEGAHGGYRANEFNAGISQSLMADMTAVVQPDVVIVALGLNEYIQAPPLQRTAAQFRKDMVKLIGGFRVGKPDVSVIVVIEHQPALGYSTLAPDLFSSWRDSWIAIANETHSGQFDFRDGVGNFLTTGSPYEAGDGLHYNDLGMDRVAQVAHDYCIQTLDSNQYTTTSSEVPIPLLQNFVNDWTKINGALVASAGYNLDSGGGVYRITDNNGSASAGVSYLLPAIAAGKRYRFTLEYNIRTLAFTSGTGAQYFAVGPSNFSAAIGVFTRHSVFTTATGSFGTNTIFDIDSATIVSKQSPYDTDFRQLAIEVTALVNSTDATLQFYPMALANSNLGYAEVSKPQMIEVY